MFFKAVLYCWEAIGLLEKIDLLSWSRWCSILFHWFDNHFLFRGPWKRSLLVLEAKENVEADGFGLRLEAETDLMSPAGSTGAFPIQYKGVMHGTSMLAHRFEDSNRV